MASGRLDVFGPQCSRRGKSQIRRRKRHLQRRCAHERCRAFLPIPENDRAWNEPTSVTFTQRFSEPAIPEEGASLRKEPERSRQPFNRTQREEQT
jgi:hypothetical protein